MRKKFPEYDALDLASINKEMNKTWKEEDLFQESLDRRNGATQFVFYEGPPSANGMPGIHHVVGRTIKDMICRYKSMKGFKVDRKAGWDTHGLPVELGVEKKLGITKENIGKTISVSDYNSECRKEVMKYTKEWEELTHQMGYWIDTKDPYVTCDNRYIESLWYLLSELYKKDLLYKGYTIQPYSPAAGTGLSSHELNLPGCYRDVKDTTCIAQFKIKNPKAGMDQFGEAFFLAWTTTPWTLPSNVFLAVGAQIEYVAVETYNPYMGNPVTLVLAKNLVDRYFSPKNSELSMSDYKVGDKQIPFKVSETIWTGKDLEDMEYEQLIPFLKLEDNSCRVLCADFVSIEEGTGIVHIAPTFGADDARLGKSVGSMGALFLNKDRVLVPMVDLSGKYYKIEDLDPEFVATHINKELYGAYAGRYVKNEYDNTLPENADTLDTDICVMLKKNNRVFKIEKYVHSYPHCWRTDKPILYYPLDSWFIRSTACKDKMIELNKTINWKPQSTGTGRFGKWLENLQDWNLSRSRYWGTPLPIWRTENGSEEKCISSIKHLLQEIEKSIKFGFMKECPWKGVSVDDEQINHELIDLHRPFVDEIILVSETGKPMYRELDLIDVWFDSGAMPFAQVFYPHISEEEFEKVYPADFISEGVDQTRGWFFTLHAISTMIRGQVAFKNVISNGLVLDKNGNKMSKRLGNAINPFQVIDKYGSDPLRWYLMTNAAPWENVKFDIDGVIEVQRKFFGTLYNTYSFFALYANVDGFDNSQPTIPVNERPEIDRWILSRLNTLVKNVNELLDDYDPTKSAREIAEFLGKYLSNWYVRLNRKRFWGGEMSADKLSAYQTLYTCLITIAKLTAPVIPFYADRLYRDLAAFDAAEADSVHLSDFPVADESLIDEELESRMDYAQSAASIILALRRKSNIKVRQPLSKIMIPVLDDRQKAEIESVKNIILAEVNVKEIQYVDSSETVLVKKVKPDFKKLGPRYGKIMKLLSEAIASMSQSEISQMEREGFFDFKIENEIAHVTTSDVEILSEDIPGWLVGKEGRLTIALDLTIDDDLRNEGIARELINRIQNLRKSSGFEITDKIDITIQLNDLIVNAINQFKEYICQQVLANSIKIVTEELPEKIEIDEHYISIEIKK